MKKIIATMVAVMAASVFSAAPASAVPTITVAGGVSVGNTSATPYTATVPADNKIDAADAVLFSFAGLTAGSTVSAVTSNAFIVPKLNAVDAPVTASSGVTSYSVNTGTGTTAEFYVYTKSTSVGTVTVTSGGSTWTYYVKGTTSTAYSFSVTISTVIATGSTSTAVVNVLDVFGNPVAVAPTVTAFNATAAAVLADANVAGRYSVAITYPTTAGKSALSFAVAGVDESGSPQTKTASFFVDVIDLSVENAKLKEQLNSANAALTAEKSAHDATKKTLAETKAMLDSVNAKLATLETSVTKLRLWVSKLKALVKSLR